MKIEDLVFKVTSDGQRLVPVVTQDYVTREVLMLGFANEEALSESARTGFAHYWSRSRKRLWKKGETSGNFQQVIEMLADCDGDAVLYLVKQTGPACHLGSRSCFRDRMQRSEHLTDNSENQTINEIIQAYARSRVVERKWHGRGERQLYRYIVNPITENIPPPDPFWSEWIARKIHRQTSNDIGKVVTAEALGLPIAQLVASLKGKPLAVVRKRDFYDRSNLLLKARYASGFEHGTYWVYGVSKGESVLIVDDAVSTGGTLAALVSALQKNGVNITDVFCVLEKPEYQGVRIIQKATGVLVKTLFQVDTKSRKCVPTKYALPDSFA